MPNIPFHRHFGLYLAIIGLAIIPISDLHAQVQVDDQVYQILNPQNTEDPTEAAPVSTPAPDNSNDYTDEVFEKGPAMTRLVESSRSNDTKAEADIADAQKAQCDKSKAIIQKLYQKNHILAGIQQDPCQAGATGTPSAAALEDIQKTVGLYPESTMLPQQAPDRGYAGKPTELTLLALDVLPAKPPEGYTSNDIDAAVEAINRYIENKQTQALEEHEAAVENANKSLKKNPNSGALVPPPQVNIQ